ADHSQRLIVERDRLSDEIRIRIEASLPETMTNDRNRIPARHGVFISRERATLLRSDAQDVEIVSRNGFAPDLLDLVRITKIELPDAVGGESTKNVVVIAKVDIARIRSGRVRLLFALADVKLDHFFRMRDRPRLQED